MEWGTFITVVFAVYLVWYGLNFLFDLFVGSKPKRQPEQTIQYNLSDFAEQEEKAQVVHEKDFEQPAVTIVPTAETPAHAVSNTGGSAQRLASPAPIPDPAPAVQHIPMPATYDDWASVIDQEEETISIPVQGQPVPVTDFIQSFKNEAKLQAASIFS